MIGENLQNIEEPNYK